MYEWVAMYISTVYSIPPLLISTPADSPQSETVSSGHVSDTILSQKVYGELYNRHLYHLKMCMSV